MSNASPRADGAASSRASGRLTLRSLPTPVWVLSAGLFINAFGNFLPVFLVLYLTTHGASAAQAGLALSCYGASRLVAPILGGALADRASRRVVIAAGMTVNAAAVAVVPGVTGLHQVMALAAVAGAGAGVGAPAAAALMADLVPVAQRVQGFAVQRLAVNFGYATGPAAAGLLVTHGFRWLFIVQAVTSATFAVISLTALPSMRPVAIARTTRAPAPDKALQSLARPQPARLLVALVAIHVVYYQVLTTLPLVVRAAGGSPAMYGALASLNGLLVIVLELPIAARTRRTPRQPTVAAGFLLIAVGVSCLGLVRHGTALPLLIGCVVLYTVGEMVFDPVAQTYATELAPPGLQACYQAAFASAANAGYLLAPLVAGALYAPAREVLWLLCLALGVTAAGLVVAGQPRRLEAGARRRDLPGRSPSCDRRPSGTETP